MKKERAWIGSYFISVGGVGGVGGGGGGDGGRGGRGRGGSLMLRHLVEFHSPSSFSV